MKETNRQQQQQQQHDLTTTTKTKTIQPPAPTLPQQVLDQYRERHSVDTLQQEFSSNSQQLSQNRQYLVVYYSCPHAAGNMLHDMYNQLFCFISFPINCF